MGAYYTKVTEGIRKLFVVNRATLMRAHYDALCSHVSPKTEGEKKELAYFKRTFETHYKRTATLMNVRVLLYTFLYASIAVNLLQTFPLLSFLVDFVQIGSALFGTAVLVALVFWTTLRINARMEVMGECLAQVIALYHKNPKRDSDAVIRLLRKKL